MSKSVSAGAKPKNPAAAANVPTESVRPLKPRRALFAVLLLFFLLWVGGLLWMWWKTVYPMRHPAQQPAPAARS
ncbi:MAG TPA: hypothetical protein VEA69_03460 [Tepidisphaeraceae bacterium]|nr:hypothetical protein [Tepidisphaeraceae bacterium]